MSKTKNRIEYEIKKKEREAETVKYRLNLSTTNMVGFVGILLAISIPFIIKLTEGIPSLTIIAIFITFIGFFYLVIVKDLLKEIEDGNKKLSSLNGEIDSLYNNLLNTNKPKKKKKGRQ